MDETAKKILEIVTDTQTRIENLEDRMLGVEGELRVLKQDTTARFDGVDEHLRDIRGFSKEIDYTNEKVASLDVRMSQVEGKVA